MNYVPSEQETIADLPPTSCGTNGHIVHGCHGTYMYQYLQFCIAFVVTKLMQEALEFIKKMGS
jgi:gamma-glutamyl phosphate reductase